MSISQQVKQNTDDEAAIKELMKEWSRAIESKDIDRLMKGYVSDIVLYDVKPPYKISGVEDYHAMWEACLPYFPDGFKSEHHDIKIEISGDLAVAHCMHHFIPKEKDHPIGQTWVRVTVCYKRIDNEWKVFHEHVSVPFDPMTGQTAFIEELH